MNATALVLGLAFAAIGAPFVARAKREAEPAQRRNKASAGYFFLAAAAAFLVAFAASVATD